MRAVSRLAPYAIHVHAKDMYYSNERREGWGHTRGGGSFMGAVLGRGDVPVKKCIDVLKLAGYNGYLSVEFEGREDCIEAIEHSHKYLLEVLG